MAEKSSHAGNESYFHSLDCDILWLDKPGDNTVRPCPPNMLEFMTALRARVQAAEAAEAERKSAQNGQRD